MENERSTIDLMSQIRRHWKFLRDRPKQMETLVASVPTRLQVGIDGQGGWTGYQCVHINRTSLDFFIVLKKIYNFV